MDCVVILHAAVRRLIADARMFAKFKRDNLQDVETDIWLSIITIESLVYQFHKWVSEARLTEPDLFASLVWLRNLLSELPRHQDERTATALVQFTDDKHIEAFEAILATLRQRIKSA